MSKKLDDELANAAGLNDANDEAPAVVKPTAPSAPRKHGAERSIGLLAALLVMVGAIVALFLVGFKEAAIYATPVDQLVASRDKLAGRKVRVEGELVPGTLEKRDQPCEYRFRIHGPKSEVPVRYAQCVIPDTFRDVPGGGVQVTVEGALATTGDFEATLVMAKCSSKYDPSTHQMSQAEKKAS
jgi:cytochrome c-type biogenesis protein CcmE